MSGACSGIRRLPKTASMQQSKFTGNLIIRYLKTGHGKTEKPSNTGIWPSALQTSMALLASARTHFWIAFLKWGSK